MTMMSRLSTDEEPGPRPTNISQADNHEEVTLRDEEVIKLDQEPGEEEIRAMETTAIEMETSAIFAKSRDTGKRSAGNDLRRTSHALTLKDDTTGPKSTSWMKTPKPKLSTLFITKKSEHAMRTIHLTLPDSSVDQEPQPFPSNSRVLSKELDDSPHPSS